MGRKTFEAIGKVLPGRTNVVMTRDPHYTLEGVVVAHSAEEVLDRFEVEDIYVIGGAQIIREFLPFTDYLYITLVEHEFEGDTFFPEIDMTQWELVSEERGLKNEQNPFDYVYLIYKRK